MKKNILIGPPIGSGFGFAIFNGCLNGFSHIEWHRVISCMAICFTIVAAIYLYSRSKN